MSRLLILVFSAGPMCLLRALTRLASTGSGSSAQAPDVCRDARRCRLLSLRGQHLGQHLVCALLVFCAAVSASCASAPPPLASQAEREDGIRVHPGRFDLPEPAREVFTDRPSLDFGDRVLEGDHSTLVVHAGGLLVERGAPLVPVTVETQPKIRVRAAFWMDALFIEPLEPWPAKTKIVLPPTAWPKVPDKTLSGGSMTVTRQMITPVFELEGAAPRARKRGSSRPQPLSLEPDSTYKILLHAELSREGWTGRCVGRPLTPFGRPQAPLEEVPATIEVLDVGLRLRPSKRFEPSHEYQCSIKRPGLGPYTTEWTRSVVAPGALAKGGRSFFVNGKFERDALVGSLEIHPPVDASKVKVSYDGLTAVELPEGQRYRVRLKAPYQDVYGNHGVPTPWAWVDPSEPTRDSDSRRGSRGVMMAPPIFPTYRATPQGTFGLVSRPVTSDSAPERVELFQLGEHDVFAMDYPGREPAYKLPVTHNKTDRERWLTWSVQSPSLEAGAYGVRLIAGDRVLRTESLLVSPYRIEPVVNLSHVAVHVQTDEGLPAAGIQLRLIDGNKTLVTDASGLAHFPADTGTLPLGVLVKDAGREYPVFFYFRGTSEHRYVVRHGATGIFATTFLSDVDASADGPWKVPESGVNTQNFPLPNFGRYDGKRAGLKVTIDDTVGGTPTPVELRIFDPERPRVHVTEVTVSATCENRGRPMRRLEKQRLQGEWRHGTFKAHILFPKPTLEAYCEVYFTAQASGESYGAETKITVYPSPYRVKLELLERSAKRAVIGVKVFDRKTNQRVDYKGPITLERVVWRVRRGKKEGPPPAACVVRKGRCVLRGEFDVRGGLNLTSSLGRDAVDGRAEHDVPMRSRPPIPKPGEWFVPKKGSVTLIRVPLSGTSTAETVRLDGSGVLRPQPSDLSQDEVLVLHANDGRGARALHYSPPKPKLSVPAHHFSDQSLQIDVSLAGLPLPNVEMDVIVSPRGSAQDTGGRPRSVLISGRSSVRSMSDSARSRTNNVGRDTHAAVPWYRNMAASWGTRATTDGQGKLVVTPPWTPDGPLDYLITVLPRIHASSAPILATTTVSPRVSTTLGEGSDELRLWTLDQQARDVEVTYHLPGWPVESAQVTLKPGDAPQTLKMRLPRLPAAPRVLSVEVKHDGRLVHQTVHRLDRPPQPNDWSTRERRFGERRVAERLTRQMVKSERRRLLKAGTNEPLEPHLVDLDFVSSLPWMYRETDRPGAVWPRSSPKLQRWVWWRLAGYKTARLSPARLRDFDAELLLCVLQDTCVLDTSAVDLGTEEHKLTPIWAVFKKLRYLQRLPGDADAVIKAVLQESTANRHTMAALLGAIHLGVAPELWHPALERALDLNSKSDDRYMFKERTWDTLFDTMVILAAEALKHPAAADLRQKQVSKLMKRDVIRSDWLEALLLLVPESEPPRISLDGSVPTLRADKPGFLLRFVTH